MIERTPVLDAVTHLVLVGGLLIAFAPLWLVFVASTLTLQEVNQPHLTILPGVHLLDNLAEAWARAGLGWKLFNSLFTSVMVAGGKVLISAVTAFAIVFFRFPGRMLAFWAIFVTLMLPLEVRIVPTYAVAANVLAPVQGLAELTGFDGLWRRLTGTELLLEWNLLNSYSGLILPLVATATGTFLYRQFFMTIPGEIVEAARMDGAGPLRTFREIILPLSRANMVALFTIMFLYAWNQYLWPTLITTDRAHFGTAVIALRDLVPISGDSTGGGNPDWNVAMAAALMVMAPPLLLVVLMQRFFIRGLVATEK